MTGYVRIT